jgi:hypothetical protein
MERSEKRPTMNSGLFVRLRPDEVDRLAEIAKAERRPIRDQAAVLLTGALERELTKHALAEHIPQNTKEAVDAGTTTAPR